ncbi:MAG: nuclear transport factor 2 family protein [Ignavibacteria bacterium]|nr:nuclear transport factor 2 family protein [Ignavibacteria bacterium]
MTAGNSGLCLRYLDMYCSGRDLHELTSLLAEDLHFEGPLAEFSSAREYIDALLADPPSGCRYNLLHQFEKGEYVNLIYRFTRGDVTTVMSQLFRVRNGTISSTRLIFDTAPFLSRTRP